ncbi:hypothetical protein FRB99_006256 [Tulasnella sp. 403]|nr:hypothetical protein FRB99_006256 [Tulasnella sp. 403]
MPTKPYKHFRPLRRPNEYYKDYDKLVDDQDKNLLAILHSNLDIILIFAALFSGINGAFIAITLNILLPSPTDTTNALLHFLIQRIDNTTVIPSDVWPPPTFPGLTRINCYFCASLACSIVVALGAFTSKQCLIYYNQAGGTDMFQSRRSWKELEFKHRGRERLRKVHGPQRMQLRAIIEAGLPTLLQVAVYIFYIGLIDFMRAATPTIGWLTLGIAGAAFGAYVLTIGAAMWNPDCLFQTPLTKAALLYIYHPMTRFLSYPYRSIKTMCSFILGLFPGLTITSNELQPFSQAEGNLVQDEPKMDEIYAPSTDDIEVVSWILSTSMKPQGLRTAAASLPYLHVPSVLTTKHLDTSAISRLQLLFRDAYTMYLTSKIPSSDSVSDLLTYGEALFHALLASLVEEAMCSGSTALRPLPWWKLYYESMQSTTVWGNPLSAVPELQNHYELATNSVMGFGYHKLGGSKWSPVCDPDKSPLHFAAILYLDLSSGTALESSLSHLIPCFDVTQKSATDRRNGNIPSWSIVSMVALALTILPERDVDIEANRWSTDPERVKNIKAVWDAYTDDEQLFSNFANACRVYEEKMRTSEAADRAYKWLICSMRDVIDDAEKVDCSWAEVAQGSIHASSVAAHRYPKEPTMLKVVRDCLCIALKHPGRITLDGLAPLWPIVLAGDTPTKVLEPVMEAIADIARSRRAGLYYPDDIINTAFFRRILELLKGSEEAIRLHTLHLLYHGVRRKALNDFLSVDVIRTIAGQLKLAPTRERDVFYAVIRLSGEAAFLKRRDQQSVVILVQIFVEEALSEPFHVSAVAAAVVCWNDVRRYAENGAYGKGGHHRLESQYNVGTGAQVEGASPQTSEDNCRPPWFSDKMIDAVTEYLNATSAAPDSWHSSECDISKAVENYHQAVDAAKQTVETQDRQTALLRFREAFEQYQGRRKGSRLHSADSEKRT